jgi:hypothetical protein
MKNKNQTPKSEPDFFNVTINCSNKGKIPLVPVVQVPLIAPFEIINECNLVEIRQYLRVTVGSRTGLYLVSGLNIMFVSY